MENYPPNWLAHICPLVAVQGAGGASANFSGSKQESEALFRNQPELSGSNKSLVQDLLKFWKKFTIENVVFDTNSIRSQQSLHRYKFKLVANDYRIPVFDEEAEEIIPNDSISLNWIDLYNDQLPCLVISVYELDDSLTDTEEIKSKDQELINEMISLKNQLLTKNLKYLSIVITASQDAERLDSLRRQTGLNQRNGLLILNPNSKPKELNTLAMDILSIIKPTSVEFYTSIEKKLRKIHQKSLTNIQLTSATDDDIIHLKLQVNFSLKIAIIEQILSNYESSLKSLELAYDTLSQVLNTIPINTPNSPYSHYRLLLDLIIFQIVKICLYLESPNPGFRKFEFHLKSIVYYLRRQKYVSTESVNWWLSRQFKWLAQLIDLCPNSLIGWENAYVKEKDDQLSDMTLKHCGFLYLQCVDLLQRMDPFDESFVDDYLPVPKNLNIDDELINLLTFAKLAFQKKDHSFNRTISYINFQLANIHFRNSQVDKSFKLFELVLDTLKEDQHWDYLEGEIYHKLLLCSIELKKYYGTVLNLLELCLLENIDENIKESLTQNLIKNDALSNFLKQHDEKVVINASTDDSFDLVESQILFKNSKVSLSDDILLQVELNTKLNHSFLEEFELDNLLLEFDGSLPSILIVNDDEHNNSHELIKLTTSSNNEDENQLVFKTNLRFNSSSSNKRIIQLSFPTAKIGRNTLVSMSGVLKVGDLFEVNLTIPISNDAFKIHHIWYELNESRDELYQTIIKNRNNNSIEIIPRIPKTKVNWLDVPKVAFIGEKLRLGVKVQDDDHEEVDIEISGEILLNDDKNTKIELKWEDEEGSKLYLKGIEKSKELLKFFEFKSPQLITGKEAMSVRLVVTFFVGNDYDTPIRSLLSTHSISIVNPFMVTLAIHPRLKSNDLPSLFLMHDDDKIIPKPSRFWLMKTLITVKEEYQGFLEVLDDTITISNNPNSNTTCEEDVSRYSRTSYRSEENEDVEIIESNHYFDTRIDDGHTYRNIQFEAQLGLNWKRTGQEKPLVNEYFNDSWKLSLPFLDPRVLLDVELNSENNEIKLKYYIENPTSKIFTFNINLLENQNFQISSGLKKLPNLDILPINRQCLNFNAILQTEQDDDEGTPIQLPVLKVYDVNYRVNLPTLSISDHVTSIKNDLYLKP